MLVHGSNLAQKETHGRKYLDDISRAYLAEIRVQYDKWYQANTELIGPTSIPTENDQSIVDLRVRLLNEYKDLLDQQQYAEKFDSRSNLHSSVIEEFLYYLFRDLVADFGSKALIGKSHAFKDIFFAPPNYRSMTESSYARMETKDHDFVIGVTIEANMRLKTQDQKQAIKELLDRGALPLVDSTTERYLFDVAAVAIECKTYLDKTMLEGSSQAAEQLKVRNPNALYVVVAEWLKLTSAVNLRKYKVDQIYILRKQKNTDREYRYFEGYSKNSIYPEVVWKLFQQVRDHLTKDWESTIEKGLDRGWLL